MVEGAPHMAKRSMINLCLYGVPHPPYIKEWRRGRASPLMARPRGSPTPGGSRIPPSLVGVGEEGSGREREGKGAGPPPNSDWAWGCALHLGRLLLSPTMAQ